MFILSQFL